MKNLTFHTHNTVLSLMFLFVLIWCVKLPEKFAMRRYNFPFILNLHGLQMLLVHLGNGGLVVGLI